MTPVTALWETGPVRSGPLPLGGPADDRLPALPACGRGLYQPDPHELRQGTRRRPEVAPRLAVLRPIRPERPRLVGPDGERGLPALLQGSRAEQPRYPWPFINGVYTEGGCKVAQSVEVAALGVVVADQWNKQPMSGRFGDIQAFVARRRVSPSDCAPTLASE